MKGFSHFNNGNLWTIRSIILLKCIDYENFACVFLKTRKSPNMQSGRICPGLSFHPTYFVDSLLERGDITAHNNRVFVFFFQKKICKKIMGWFKKKIVENFWKNTFLQITNLRKNNSNKALCYCIVIVITFKMSYHLPLYVQ